MQNMWASSPATHGKALPEQGRYRNGTNGDTRGERIASTTAFREENG